MKAQAKPWVGAVLCLQLFLFGSGHELSAVGAGEPPPSAQLVTDPGTSDSGASTQLSTTELDRVPLQTEGSQKEDSARGNARIGTATVRLVGGLAVAFNDNINYSEFDRLADIIITPNAEFNLLWPVTDYNTLTFDLGVSYDKYLIHPEADTNGINLAPDSNLTFRAQVGEHVVLKFFDRFSFQQTPLDEPTVSNTSDYSRFENSVGVEWIWAVNRVLEYTGRYAYGTWLSFDSSYDYLDRSSHTFSNSVKYELNPALYTGINSSVVITDYDEDFQNDNTMLRIGPFVRAKVTENTEVGGEIQYVTGWFDDNGGGAGNNGDSSAPNSVNFMGDITNRFNPRASQRLAVGYETLLGTSSNYYNLAYARYDMAWQIFPAVSTDFQLFYEYGDESGGFDAEAFHRYGTGLRFSYRLTKSVVSSAGYRFTVRDSDAYGSDYYQNVFTVDFDYRF